jgi:predicted house-cleaning noncanonical NTP pyrophosphatase (MazG superfamily)
MRTFRFDKIVRDLIPKRTLSQGGKVKLADLTAEERYGKLVNDKVDEELTEVRKAATKLERLEELADVIEVMYGAAEQLGATEAEVDSLRAKKTKEKGGFKKAPFVETVTVPDDNPWVQSFLDEPDRYPEEK